VLARLGFYARVLHLDAYAEGLGVRRRAGDLPPALMPTEKESAPDLCQSYHFAAVGATYSNAT